MSWLADRFLIRFSLLTAGECYFLAINQRTVKVKMRTAGDLNSVEFSLAPAATTKPINLTCPINIMTLEPGLCFITVLDFKEIIPEPSQKVLLSMKCGMAFFDVVVKMK